MIHSMVFYFFALACINADEMCTCVKVAMFGSTLEQRSCLLPAWGTDALVLWFGADWNLTLKCK
jgi:hypothetical protein